MDPGPQIRGISWSKRRSIYTLWDLLVGNSTWILRKVANFTHIIAAETTAVVKHVLPAALTWMWRKHVSREIITLPLDITVEGVRCTAYLNLHGKLDHFKDQEVHAVLLTHGDHSHPYMMLHLADIAERENLLTFSLYIPKVHIDQRFQINAALLKTAIDTIEDTVEAQEGTFAGILGTGHSRGAILLSHQQFVNLDVRMKATCSIAGRLNAENENDNCSKSLSPIVNTIHAGIMQNSQLPLLQIVPKRDWNAPQSAMAVRPHAHCHSVPGMHLSGLFKGETQSHFTHFLKTFNTKA